MITKKTGLFISSALVASFMLPSIAFAQDDNKDVIYVTATKRTTTLQETPVAVSVTTAEVLEKAQILDIQDLQSVVPTLRVGQLQSSANTNFRIRGFGNGANNAGIEPSVGVFIDGVYRSRSAAQIGDLPKLERIEVLSGPQSTLFGKNASAGVISIVTAKPSFETQGYVEGGFGNYDQKLFKAYITSGITDTMAVSLGGGMNSRDGYAESAIGLAPNNARDRWNLRGQFLWEPTDDLSLRIIGDYNEIDEICCHVTNATNGPTAAAIGALGGQFADDANPFAYINYQNRDSNNLIEDRGVSAELNYDFGNVALTSITSYRKNDAANDYDADFTTARLLDVLNDTDVKTVTQELRLTSTGDRKLDWMVGGYYFNEDITQSTGLDYGSQLRSYIDLLTGSPAILSTIELTNGFAVGTFFGDQVQTEETFTQDNTAYSFFGTADFHVNDRLTITGGLNYTNDEKTITGSTVNNDLFSNLDLNTANGINLLAGGAIAGAFGDPTDPIYQAFLGAFGVPLNAGTQAFIAGGGAGAAAQAGYNQVFVPGIMGSIVSGLVPLQFQPQFLAFPNVAENGETNDDKVTYTIRGAYEVNDNINVFASYATGFKSTSWNLSRDSRPFIGDAGALASLLPNNYFPNTGRNFGTRYAGPEEASVIEFGLKARFDKGAFNVTVFDQSIEGFQSNTFLGTGFVLSNAGKQSTKGVEFDATYSPMEALKLTFAGVYLDAVYDSFVGAPGPNSTTVDRSGQKVAGVPEFGFSTSATYSHEFENGMDGFIRADYQYESEVDIVEILGVKADTSNVNASAGLKFENGVSLQAWGRNIFGHESYISAFPGVVQAGTINGYPTAPATYGFLVRKTF